jgi:hypothetical protein
VLNKSANLYVEAYKKLKDLQAEEKVKISTHLNLKECVEISTAEDIETLVDLIASCIKSKNHSLCDIEDNIVAENITYCNMRNLTFAYLNAVIDIQSKSETYAFFETEIFPLYRHSKAYECKTLLDTMYNSSESKSCSNCYTVKSLHYWAKENPNYKVHFPEKEPIIGLFNRDDSEYKFGHFKRYIEDTVFETYDLLEEYFLLNFPRVCIIETDNNNIFHLKKQPEFWSTNYELDPCLTITLNCHYNEKNSKNVTVEKEIKFKNLIEKLIKKMKRYDCLKFHPRDIYTSESNAEKITFNLFDGFKAKKLDILNMKKITILLDHIKYVLADGNEINNQYILSWLSHIVKFPHLKTKIMLILYSDSCQTGKGSFAEFWLKHVIGMSISCKTPHLHQIAGKFNQITSNKLMIVLDDTTQHQNYENGFWDTLKSVITDNLQTIEKKGKDPIQVMDYTNYMLLTNHSNAVKIDQKDRRTAVFKVSNEKVGNTEYFKKLHDSLDQECADNFFTYLYNRTDENVDILDIPNTEARSEMIINTSEQPIKFFEMIKQKEHEFIAPNEIIYKDNNQYLLCSDLFLEFQHWSKTCNEKNIYSMQKFSKFASQEFGKSHRFNKKRYYDITPLFA